AEDAEGRPGRTDGSELNGVRRSQAADVLDSTVRRVAHGEIADEPELIAVERDDVEGVVRDADVRSRQQRRAGVNVAEHVNPGDGAVVLVGEGRGDELLSDRDVVADEGEVVSVGRQVK